MEIFAHLALDAALRGQLRLQTVIRALTAGPARLYGLYPRKGALIVGSDADLLVYDSEAETTVRTATWISRSRNSARLFEGRTYRGPGGNDLRPRRGRLRGWADRGPSRSRPDGATVLGWR